MHVPVSYSLRTTQYAQQRLVRDLCDLTVAVFAFRTTWNRLWASIHLLHQNRENTLSNCTLHFLIGTNHTGPSAQIWHPPPCRTCHSLSRSCAHKHVENPTCHVWQLHQHFVWNVVGTEPTNLQYNCLNLGRTQSWIPLIRDVLPTRIRFWLILSCTCCARIHKKTCPHHRVRQTWCSSTCWCFFAPARTLMWWSKSF